MKNPKTEPETFGQVLSNSTSHRESIVTLLTDFGQTDGFVGVMKGVILQIAPQTRLIDISHELPPFSIAGAAFLMEWAYGYYPQGTVHLCVVDPGVGTHRRILLLETQGHFFVAPDNGLLTPLLTMPDEKLIISATNPRYWLDAVSATFHGRDIFSPLAAHIVNGASLAEMGDSINDPILLPLEPLQIDAASIQCRIVYIDRFGNLITNLRRTTWESWKTANRISLTDVTISGSNLQIQGISHTYREKAENELVAVFDGYDRLEIAACGGNAARTTGLRIGDAVCVTIHKNSSGA